MPARTISSGGRHVGYEAPVCILTERAAKALSKVQQSVAGDGLTLVVFDCYRPVRAVDDFVDWTRQGGPPDPRWYPKVKRGDLIAKGYVGERSSHSRGSTVDVALGHIDVAAATSLPDPDCGAHKDRHAGIRHRLRLLRPAQLHRGTRRCRKAPPPTARSWSMRWSGGLPQLLARMVAFHADK